MAVSVITCSSACIMGIICWAPHALRCFTPLCSALLYWANSASLARLVSTLAAPNKRLAAPCNHIGPSLCFLLASFSEIRSFLWFLSFSSSHCLLSPWAPNGNHQPTLCDTRRRWIKIQAKDIPRPGPEPTTSALPSPRRPLPWVVSRACFPPT